MHAYGVELKAGLDWQPAPDWQLNADGNFSWTPSINNGDPVDWYDKAIGKQLVYIPEYSASVTGRLTYRSWRFIYKWCYYSERFTTSDNSMKTKIGRVKPYFMSDVSLEKAFFAAMGRLHGQGGGQQSLQRGVRIGAFASDAAPELRTLPRYPAALGQEKVEGASGNGRSVFGIGRGCESCGVAPYAAGGRSGAGFVRICRK